MVILSDVVVQLSHKQVTEYFSTCKLTFVRIVLYRVLRFSFLDYSDL